MKTTTIILGIVTIVLGVCAITMPFKMFLSLGWLVGVLFLVYGIEAVFGALKKEKKDVWGCILGVLTAFFGAWITVSAVQRALTDLTIAYLVGFGLICNGVFRFFAAYHAYKKGEKKQTVMLIICGVLAVIGGMMSVGHPIITMISVGYIIAFSLLAQGIGTVMAGCAMKK